MSTTINDIAKLLKSDDKKGDTSFWGIVHSTIEDGEGNVTGYNVSLDGSANGAVKCNKVVGAKQGDQVLVTLRANGEAVVVATKGGDTDVQDVVTDLEENYYTADEVDEKIAEVEGGSYQIIEWARSSSTSTAPTTGWSTTMPTLTTSYPYLWQRIVTVTGETRTAGTPQRAETMDGLYVFMNRAKGVTSGATVIDGGAIDTNTLYLGRIGSDGQNYAEVTSSGMNIVKSGKTLGTYGANRVYNCANPDDGYSAKIDLYSDTATLSARTTSVSAQGSLSLSGGTVLSLTSSQIDIGDGYGLIHINDETLADFVTTQSSSGNWKYRKWSSGKVEAWYKGTVSGGSTSSENNVHRCTYTLSIPSGIFSSAPTVLVSVRDQPTKVFSITGEATSATSMRGAIFRANSDSGSTTYYISVYAWS